MESTWEVREIPGTGQIAVRKLSLMPTAWRVFQFFAPLPKGRITGAAMDEHGVVHLTMEVDG